MITNITYTPKKPVFINFVGNRKLISKILAILPASKKDDYLINKCIDNAELAHHLAGVIAQDMNPYLYTSKDMVNIRQDILFADDTNNVGGILGKFLAKYSK